MHEHGPIEVMATGVKQLIMIGNPSSQAFRWFEIRLLERPVFETVLCKLTTNTWEVFIAPFFRQTSQNYVMSLDSFPRSLTTVTPNFSLHWAGPRQFCTLCFNIYGPVTRHTKTFGT